LRPQKTRVGSSISGDVDEGLLCHPERSEGPFGSMHCYYVYILTIVSREVMYIVVTNDLERRIADHCDGRGGSFTRKYRLNTLVHVEEFQFIDEAITREKEIKGWRRSKKDALVQASNPTWADLSGTGSVKG